MTTNQVASAIASFAGLVFFWMLDWISEIADAGWASFFKAISPLDRYQEFTAGILDLANIAYFCFFVFFFLFLTLRSIETRNWRG
jgi:ABC-2 type transport system permease protein